MLKVSVVMAVYNGERFISQQLRSIAAQSLAPDEIIIVDDCSDDSSPALISRFSEESGLNVKYFRNEKNLGFCENFKKALSLAGGDVMLLCDQDDVWEPDKIEKLAEVFEDGSVKGCAAGFRFIDENGVPFENELLRGGARSFLEPAPDELFSGIPLEKVARRNIAPGCACAFGKEAVGVFVDSGTSLLPHDHQLSAIAAALDGFYYYDLPLTRYRIHGGNTLGLKSLDRTRLEIALEKVRLAGVAAEASQTGKEYLEVAKKRYENMKNGKPLGILSMLFSRQYKRYFTFKERMGDLVYAIRR